MHDAILHDSKFVAANENSHTKSDRYDENGVFSMGCARHGIPERLYDIYGGEGYFNNIGILEYLIIS